jgi:hypothetical protein
MNLALLILFTLFELVSFVGVTYVYVECSYVGWVFLWYSKSNIFTWFCYRYKLVVLMNQ